METNSISYSITTVGKYDDFQLSILKNGQIVGSSRWTSKPEIAEEIFEEEFFEVRSEIHAKSKVIWIKSFYIEKQFRQQGLLKELIKKTLEEIELSRNRDHWVGLFVAPHMDQMYPIHETKLSKVYEQFGFEQFHQNFMFYR